MNVCLSLSACAPPQLAACVCTVLSICFKELRHLARLLRLCSDCVYCAVMG